MTSVTACCCSVVACQLKIIRIKNNNVNTIIILLLFHFISDYL